MNPKVANGLVVVLLAISAAGAWYITQLRSENTLLRGRLADLEGRGRPAQAPPAQEQAPASADAPSAPRALTEGQRAAMLESLKTETGKVWFTTTPNDGEAAAYQNAIQELFQQAGWDVQGDTTANFGLRTGIYFLMADDSPPSYVLTALGAFNAAAVDVSAGRGYREFNEQKKKENANWRGFDLAPDQTFIVAIGPRPRNVPAAP